MKRLNLLIIYRCGPMSDISILDICIKTDEKKYIMR